MSQDAEGSMACSNQESGQAQTQHESETAADISKDRDIAFEDFPEVKICDTEFISCCSLVIMQMQVLFTCDVVYLTG